MSVKEYMSERFKQFGPTTWSIKNKTTIYLVMVFITIFGVQQFITLPKEQFPDIVIPNIYVQTVNFGYSPKDIENLITQPNHQRISLTASRRNHHSHSHTW